MGPKETSPMRTLERSFLGGYCLLLTLLLLYLIISILPISIDGEAVTISLFGQGFGLGLETRLLLLVALVGALGACIHMGTSFALFAGLSKLDANWLWWYILRPFIGAALAIIVYLVVRGVMFSTAADSKAVNLFGILAFSGLAGMFSKQAIEWLRDIFRCSASSKMWRRSEAP